jgi:tetratricopeptide (TPR) repeat protein
MALSLDNYGAFLYQQGKYNLAEEPFRRALDISLKAFGEHHPETAVRYNNLANLLRNEKKYGEAEECYTQALNIRLATLGPVHVETARTLQGYGRLMRLKGDLTAAEDFLDRSLSARKLSQGPEHYDTILVAVELAETLLEDSKIEQAETVVNEILKSVGSVDAIPNDLKEKFESLVKRLQENLHLSYAIIAS